ncbi:heparinase II/III-like protein [Kribbella sp. VKM Ac-2569]|uniref:heparinase II/III family protein n=1 Tax=Kribbella sp. VKM Ac-2569 TaxID=2512220 RepID=UPI0010E7620A|nr:alginate lyase family protein [Kribbella sp. VKM Ac-2569]RZT26869.1 heparinase II/III-like protein [Kribbella sp. VKM Ac-2569]
MSRQPLGWYVRRLRRMSPTEIIWRTRDAGRRTAWAYQHVRPGQDAAVNLPLRKDLTFGTTLPPRTAGAVPEEARKAVIETADAILAGNLEVLGVERTDLRAPDWFRDPATGRRSDPTQYVFKLNHRNEEAVGNIKQVWELSRHHHLTQLAAAWYLTHDDQYAERVADHLNDWWRSNPFLSGVHWASGIELGLRLISWTWIRRLLNDWPEITDLFEHNELALQQIYWHQRYLAAFRSHGSSANNHVIAEAAGQLAGACAFPWFTKSARWRADAAALLEKELDANTFPSGVNRELATDYHRFVSELGLYAALEADLAGHPLSPQTWALLTRTVDVAAAIVDTSLRPPRQGDDDEGMALVLDPPDITNWSAYLSLGAAVVGAAPWWPDSPPTATSVIVGSLVNAQQPDRPAKRPDHFRDAGLTILRSRDTGPEIWCRADAGPHGFLSIAAHAHSDALSLEVRVDGVDILADPGTYCYHGEEEWRDYFRSTIAHNTVEVAGTEQSTWGGPFLWLRGATGTVRRHDENSWDAEHDGYAPVTHRRTAVLDHGVLRVEDHLDAATDVRIAWHLGPEVSVELDGSTGRLEWSSGSAVVELPAGLSWTLHRGETDPILGWYSGRFGHKVPSTTLLGSGRSDPTYPMVTRFLLST